MKPTLPPIAAQVLQSPLFQQEPPVLLDIGASGCDHALWEPIARYSILVAFDPDVRTKPEALGAGKYRQRIFLPAAAVVDERSEVPMYLTRSPFCSSTLRPDTASLSNWSFAELFDVVQEGTCRAVSLGHALMSNALERIDWFKADTQGTDLRLFLSLPEHVRRSTAVVEFEPGFIDAYQGEDKIGDVLQVMEGEGFWLSTFELNGMFRLPKVCRDQLDEENRRHLSRTLPLAPCYANLIYLNENRSIARRSVRDLLFGWIACTLQRQHGAAYALAKEAQSAYPAERFVELASHSLSTLRSQRDHPLERFFPQGVWRGLRRLKQGVRGIFQQ